MRKIFLTLKIKKSILFALPLAFWVSGHFRQTLSADVIQIDFHDVNDNRISPSDLLAYAMCFGEDYTRGKHNELIKVLKKWIKDVNSSNNWAERYKNTKKELKDLILELCRDQKQRAKYKDKTLEEVLDEVGFKEFPVSGFEAIQGLISFSMGRKCIHEWDDGENRNEVTFVLKNGRISAEDFQIMLKDIAIPIKLLFENVKGCLAENETIKQHTVSMGFQNCDLECEENCFRNSKHLGTVWVFRSNIRLSNGAFAACPLRKGLMVEKANLYCPPPNSYLKAFEGSLPEENIQYLTARTFYHLYNNNHGRAELAEFIRCNGMDTNAMGRVYQEIFVENIKNETEKERKNLREEFEIREKRCKEIETENKELIKKNDRLKNANKNLSNEITTFVQKNRELRSSLEDANKICEDRLNEYLQLKNIHENSEKEHAEAMEKIKKELEKNKSDCSLINKKLDEYKARYNDCKKETDILKQENEAQKEEIENLKAFKSTWEEKVRTFERLETGKDKLEKQLEIATKSESNLKEMLERERKKNKETIREQKKVVADLNKKLEETQKCLFEAQAKIKELQTSETNVMTTVGNVFDNEDEKEDEKISAFNSAEPVIKKNFQTHLKNEETGKSNTFHPVQFVIGKDSKTYPKKVNRKKGKWKNFEYSGNKKEQ